jgi:hypothetical protein
VFPDLDNNATSVKYMSDRGILCMRNDYVDAINTRMIDKFPGKSKVFCSFDPVEDDSQNNYPQDFLNSITPNGLPPHELKIKINFPLILLCNLHPSSGLCNGTRLVVRGFDNHAIDAEIVNGTHAKDRIFIPRIPLSPSEDLSLPFKFKRKQILVWLSFAMTINKAQGQTVLNVGVYLPEPVFSQGQLYVALSRACLKIALGFLLNQATKSTRKQEHEKYCVHGRLAKLTKFVIAFLSLFVLTFRKIFSVLLCHWF